MYVIKVIVIKLLTVAKFTITKYGVNLKQACQTQTTLRAAKASKTVKKDLRGHILQN